MKFSLAEILCFNNQYAESNSNIRSKLEENCWDIFDSITTILADESLFTAEEFEELCLCVCNIAKHIRESELSLMAIEKLLSFKANNTSISCMSLCFYTLQLSMRNISNCCSYWRGLSIVLQFVGNIFSVVDDTVCTQASFDWIEEAMIVTLVFLRAVMENDLHWKAFNVVENKRNFFRPIIASIAFETSQARGLIIGVLTSIQSVIVSSLKSFEHRRRLTDRITCLVVQAAPNLFDLFNYIERARHAAYLEAKTRIYSSKHLKSPTASTTTTTTTSTTTSTASTTHALFSDVPDETMSALVHYSLRHITHCNRYNKDEQDMDRNEWKLCATISRSQSGNSSEIPPGARSGRVATVKVGSVYSESCRASAASISALSDDIIAAKFAPLYESCAAINRSTSIMSQPVGCRHVSCAAGLRMFECVPWSVSGLGVVALHLARSLVLCEDELEAEGYRLSLPRLLSPSYLCWLCRAYLPHLLRDTSLATAEGLRGIQLLGAVTNKLQRKDIFLSPVCGIDGDELLSSWTSCETRMPSISISAASAHSMFESFEDKSCLHQVHDLDCGDSDSTQVSTTITVSQNLLIYLAAESKERLFLSQAIISAMVACSDATLRSTAYVAFKLYLIRSFEESSLFDLLLRLCDCCPFQQISGLLIDLAKECAQEAARVPDTQSTGGSGKHDHWWSDVSSQPRTAFDRIFRHRKNNSITKLPLHAPTPCTWEEWQSFYEPIHSTSTIVGASPLSNAIYDSTYHGHHRIFWSPLLVSLFFLRPLEEIIRQNNLDEDTSSRKSDFLASKPDKLDDLMDVVAARVNLMLFVALRLQAGLRDLAAPHQNPFGRYLSACNSALLPLEQVVGDLFEAVRVTHSLQCLLRSKLEAMMGVEDLSIERKKKRKSALNRDRALQVQVLEANVEYLLGHLKSLCSALLTSLANC